MKPADLHESLVGVLVANELRDLSDEELSRCLSGCVCAHTLIPRARSLRDAGVLTMIDGCPTIEPSAD